MDQSNRNHPAVAIVAVVADVEHPEKNKMPDSRINPVYRTSRATTLKVLDKAGVLNLKVGALKPGGAIPAVAGPALLL
jgi:hypothetical protein